MRIKLNRHGLYITWRAPKPNTITITMPTPSWSDAQMDRMTQQIARQMKERLEQRRRKDGDA